MYLLVSKCQAVDLLNILAQRLVFLFDCFLRVKKTSNTNYYRISTAAIKDVTGGNSTLDNVTQYRIFSNNSPGLQ